VEKILDTDQFPDALLDNTESPVEESRQTNQPQQDRRLEEFSNRLDILGSLVEQIFISPVDNARADDRLHQQYHCHVCDIKFGNSSPVSNRFSDLIVNLWIDDYRNVLSVPVDLFKKFLTLMTT
jgi:hypothetical protein